MSMLGRDAAPGAGRVEMGRGPMTGTTRAVATRQEVVHADTIASTVITAEIPAVPVHRSYGVLLPDGTVWYPGSKRRLPAPWPLRFVVWVLALVLVLLVAGLAVLELHSSWLAPLRHTVGSAPTISEPPPAGNVGGSTLVSGATTLPGQHQGWSCTTSSAGQTCTVPASSYVIDFTTASTHPCSVVILQPSGNTLYTATQPGGTTHAVPVNGSATVRVFAGGSSVAVVVGGRAVGTIQTLAYNTLYTFQPAPGASSG